ncbi:hypothetical protein PWT90_11099 [Aphanocladium album]|nr:hypothetical protein PWT90_11099 [Aphanocladium album]
MPIESEVQIEPSTSTASKSIKKAVRFQTTPMMSTYLVALVVGQLNYVESNRFRVPVRTYATVDQNIEHARFVTDLAARTLELFEKKFGVEFSLPKLDQIAVPDFASGAMENWGLITYKAAELLTEQHIGAARKRRVTGLVQHEIAHQWFGNLVTMEWWLTMCHNIKYATDTFYPEWDAWTDCVTDSLQYALHLDSLRSSHPVEVPVKHADEISQIFDGISYEKGCNVIRMLSLYLTEDIFWNGICQYLKKFKYGSTSTDDLWRCLSDASGQPVHQLAAPWVQEVGFPVITVSEDFGNNTVSVKQNRFLRTGDVKPEEDDVIYPVVLLLRTAGGVDSSTVMRQREMKLDVTAGSFFKLNADHGSIYRTLYPAPILQRLGQAAKSSSLSILDRAGLVADARELMAAGYMKTSSFLEFVGYFNSETNFFVWSEILKACKQLFAAWLFEEAATKEGIRAFFRDLLRPMAHKIRCQLSEADSQMEQQLKELIIRNAVMMGDQVTIADAKSLFRGSIGGDENAIHPTLRKTVYMTAAKYGGETECALNSMGYTEDPKSLEKLLELAIKTDIRGQDLYSLLECLRSSSLGTEALWLHFTSNWDYYRKKFPTSSAIFSNLVKVSAFGFTKPDHLHALREFYTTKKMEGCNRAVQEAFEVVQAKAAWVTRDAADLATWLKANGYLN